MAEDKLALFLKTGPDWGRMKTTIPGIFILKLPAHKSSPAQLAVELNPVDSSGMPKKKRGLVLRSFQELEEYKTLFQYDKLAPLLRTIDKLNPPVKKAVRAAGEEVLEL